MTAVTDSPGTARLHDVAILRPGSYRDMQGRPVEFSEQQLREIAANYDPRYHLATLNLDHSDSGPALGAITALRFSAGHLWADIEGLPAWLAEELRAGRWPARSAEVWSELDGRGPYLRGLALLGARAPAVRGLPALPEPVLAADSGLALISVFMEDGMESGNTDPQGGQLQRLADENRRLTAELAGHRRRESEGRVDGLLAELAAQGRLTPGMRGSGLRELLLQLADSGNALVVCLADGERSSGYDCLEQLLRSLPAHDLATPLAGGGADGTELLSGCEREIAGSLGLTDREYAEIRDGRTA
ncbi:hypothetical protein KDL44_03525 [bacterium]|nr:hypothetical protein [bacterium]